MCSGEVFFVSDICSVSNARVEASGRRGQRQQDRRTYLAQGSHRRCARAQATTSASQRLGRPAESVIINEH